MAKPVLTQEIAYTALQDFFANNKPFVLFGTGTSCAIDRNFGMESLLNQLSATIPKLTVDPIILAEWKNVEKDFSATKDFESAMNAIKRESLVELIVQETRSHVSAVDQKACLELLGKHKSWSAIYLLKKLVDNLPPGDPVLHIATPNYDMVAEYAFASTAIPYITGFWGGVVRQMDWTQSVPALIITRDLNRNIDVLLNESDNCWIVCKHEDVANNSTKIYNSKFKNWLHVDNKQLWNFDIFTTEILGG